MKVSLLGVVVVLLVLSVAYRQANAAAEKTDAGIRDVAGVLERAVADAPPLPVGPPRGPWVEHVKTECARRERLLARVRRPDGLGGIGPYARRILAVHRGHARRVVRVQPPAELLQLELAGCLLRPSGIPL